MKQTKTLQPLSPLKYYVSKPKKAIVILLVMILSICAVSFITSVLTGYLNDNYTCMEPYHYFSCVNPAKTQTTVSSSVIEEIVAYPETKEVIGCSVQGTLYQGLVAGINSSVYTLSSRDNIETMCTLVGDTLSEGRYPDYTDSADAIIYEVVLHERLLKNKGLSVGDKIGSDLNSSEALQGTFEIVGCISGPVIISFANYNPNIVSTSGINSTAINALIVIPKQGQLGEVNNRLVLIDNSEAYIATYDYYTDIMNAQTTTLYGLAVLIVVVISIIISISLGALIFIEYNSRSDEFGILYAIGYTKQFIAKKISLEIGSIMAFCWVVGYCLSLAILAIYNVAALYPYGREISVFHWFGLIATLLIPIIVSICAIFPVLLKLNKSDPIDIIERRD